MWMYRTETRLVIHKLCTWDVQSPFLFTGLVVVVVAAAVSELSIGMC